MPAIIDDDTDQDELIDTDAPEDNGNTPDDPPAKAAPAAEAPADEDEPAEPKGKMIPKGRFDEVNEERKELARQLAEVTAALAAAAGKPAAKAEEPPAPAFDLKAAMKERIQALVSGDDDKALELDERIQDYTLRRAREEAKREFDAENQQLTARQQATALAAAANEMKAKYPELDDRGDAADPDAIAFVIAKRDALIAAGKAPHEALREAADSIAKRLGFGEKSAPTNTDPVTARLVAARERNARAAAAQPPDLGGRGDRATQAARVKVEEMTDEEFASLSAAEKKRLRGDM
jgi:hypothetical protein